MINSKVVGPIKNCQICGHKNLKLILSYGHLPPVHGHFTKARLKESETVYPLNLCRCEKCHLLQLDYAADPKTIFDLDYPYHTGMTNMLVKNFRSLAEVVTKDYHLKPRDLVIDIGSNDGTLLQGFKEKGMRVLGVEPTNVAKFARKNGIPTIQTFFNAAVAKKITTKYGTAKIVTATNVFAHINSLEEFVKGVKTLIGKDGIFVSESQYLLDIIEKLELDTVYDEHLRYYSLKPMQKLFALASMSMIDAERITAAGGSIRVYAKIGEHQLSERAQNLITEEVKAGLYDVKKWEEFAKRATETKHDLVSLLIQCKKSGAKIASLGAPGRSNTLLGFTKIDAHLLDYLCEKSGSPKIGLYSPGSHIEIVDEAELIKRQPEYTLVLSWHIGEELMKKIRTAGYKGKFIMPLPVPRIVTEI